MRHWVVPYTVVQTQGLHLQTFRAFLGKPLIVSKSIIMTQTSLILQQMEMLKNQQTF